MLRTVMFASLLTVALPGAVGASPSEGAPQVTVPHDDLDLARPADRAKLERRVRRAIDKLCPGGAFERRVNFDIQRCRQVATANARAEFREAVAAATGSSSPARLAGTPEGQRS